MFLTTVQRAVALPDAVAPMVISNEDQRSGIERELALAGIDQARIVLEPVGRNTAPAVAVAALDVAAAGEDPLLLVLPADHLIADENALADAVAVATGLAANGYLVTFGVAPTRPEIGYGYIETGEQLGDSAMAVARFREKPDAETAARYVADGRHLWNSGMFMFRASRYIEELERHEPDVLRAAAAALAGAKHEGGVITLDRDALLQSASISIDYAVMERTDRAAVVSLDAGWSDVGSWQAMWDLGERDAQGNVLTGDIETIDVANSYIRGKDRLIAAIGVEGVVIVDAPDAVLIAGRDRVQEVKEIVDRLSKDRRREIESDGTETRTWGRFSTVLDAGKFRVLRLVIDPGAKTTLQTHHDRSENWIVVQGEAKIIVGDTTRAVSAGDVVYAPAGEAHHLENLSADRLLEVIQVDVLESSP
jgi:mannose-1-phosphate guanylyltransferase/mannose-6-phosphate isomerase